MAEAAVFEALQPQLPDTGAIRQALDRAAQLGCGWTTLVPGEQRLILRSILDHITLHPDTVELHIVPSRLATLTKLGSTQAGTVSSEQSDQEQTLVLSVPTALRRASMEMKLVVDSAGAAATPDPSRIRLLIRAHDL